MAGVEPQASPPESWSGKSGGSPARPQPLIVAVQSGLHEGMKVTKNAGGKFFVTSCLRVRLSVIEVRVIFAG